MAASRRAISDYLDELKTLEGYIDNDKRGFKRRYPDSEYPDKLEAQASDLITQSRILITRLSALAAKVKSELSEEILLTPVYVPLDRLIAQVRSFVTNSNLLAEAGMGTDRQRQEKSRQAYVLDKAHCALEIRTLEHLEKTITQDLSSRLAERKAAAEKAAAEAKRIALEQSERHRREASELMKKNAALLQQDIARDKARRDQEKKEQDDALKQVVSPKEIRGRLNAVVGRFTDEMRAAIYGYLETMKTTGHQLAAFNKALDAALNSPDNILDVKDESLTSRHKSLILDTCNIYKIVSTLVNKGCIAKSDKQTMGQAASIPSEYLRFLLPLYVLLVDVRKENIDDKKMQELAGLYSLAHDVAMAKENWVKLKKITNVNDRDLEPSKKKKLEAFDNLEIATQKLLMQYPIKLSYETIFKEVLKLLKNAYEKDGLFSGVNVPTFWKDDAQKQIVNLQTKLESPQYAQKLLEKLSDLKAGVLISAPNAERIAFGGWVNPAASPRNENVGDLKMFGVPSAAPAVSAAPPAPAASKSPKP